MAYDNQPVCPPTPQKQPKRSVAPRQVGANIIVDYTGKIYSENAYIIIFGKEHENPELRGKVVQIENTAITIHIYDLPTGTINMFHFAAEIRQNKKVILTDCRLETSNINLFYRGVELLSRFKSIKVRNCHGEYIHFPTLIADNVAESDKEESLDAKRVRVKEDGSQTASGANIEWRNHSVPISLMFDSRDKKADADADKFKVPAPMTKLSK